MRQCPAGPLWRFGKIVPWPWLAGVRRQMERLAHLREDITLGNAAGIALVDGRAQRLQLGLEERSSRSSVRNAARTTSLAFSKRPLSTRASTKLSSS